MVKVVRSIFGGPLEPYAAGFAEELGRQGYSRNSAAQHVCFIGHLDRWMAAGGVGVDGLSGPVMERYLAQRRAAGYREYRSTKALRPLLEYLAPLGVLPRWEDDPPSLVEELLGRYRDYLVGERGLTAATARGYVDFVRPFVTARVHGGVLDLVGLTAADVTGFVVDACPGRAVGSAKLIVCALRSLLGWLYVTGQLRRLLASCDRRTRTGRRDYAMVLLLSRLGCAPARSLGSVWTTSTGRAARSRCAARAIEPNACRCPPTWARRSRRICGAGGRPPRRAAACSSGCTPRTGR